MFQKTSKGVSGITLVALVVTIVILIILATITINVVFDDGGLIDIVKGAKNDAEDLVQSEDEKMNDLLQEYANIMGEGVEIPDPEPEVDSTPPVVTVTAGGTTTNSITVSVQATDSESGMKENPTYTYYIKKSSEADSSYQAKATDVTNANYTFTGLQQETSYDIKVEVNGDKAGNVGTGTLTGQVTTKVPGGETGVEEGAITFGSTTWSGGQASITVSTNTGMQIQYQVNSTSGSWTNISNNGTVGNLQHGQTVYARLTDGTNNGDYASASIVDGTAPNEPTISLSGTSGNNSYYKSNVTVKITAGSDGQSGANKIRYKVTGAQTIAQTDTTAGTTSTSITISTNGTSTITAYTIDKAGNVSEAKTQVVYKDSTAPSTASLTVGTVGETTIAVTAKGADSTSGVYSYAFQRSTTSSTSGFTTVATKTSTATSYSYTYTGLSDGTTYYLRVIVTDKAGNKKTGTAVTQATKAEPKPITILKAGDYVTYPSPSGDLACRVLYDSSSGYGVQLITSDTVTDSYTLGSSNFTTSKDSYNNAISTLNSAVSSYNNSTYSTVRCVGSVPNNPNQDNAGYHTTQFGSDYNGQFKDKDTNYEADYDQMGTLGIRNIGKSYWLASRDVSSSSRYSYFRVRYVDYSGSLYGNDLCYVGSSGNTRAYSYSRGLRPVFTLKSDIKVTGGNGESGTPYTLGV